MYFLRKGDIMKVSIIGASGKVGTETTRLLAEQNYFSNPLDITLFSPNNYKKIYGQLADLKESFLLRGKEISSNVIFYPTQEISQISNSALIIVCAGIFATPEEKKKYNSQDVTGRNIQSIKNCSLIRDVCKAIKVYSSSSTVLIITNQSDIMAAEARKIIQPQLVFGLGCYLDTIRFKNIFADKASKYDPDFSIKDIDATILGFHNEDMFLDENSFHLYKQVQNTEILKKITLRRTILRGREISDLQKDVHQPLINSGSSKLPAAAIFNIIRAYSQNDFNLLIPLNRLLEKNELLHANLSEKTAAQMPCLIQNGTISAKETLLSPNNVSQLQTGVRNFTKTLSSLSTSTEILNLYGRSKQNA